MDPNAAPKMKIHLAPVDTGSPPALNQSIGTGCVPSFAQLPKYEGEVPKFTIDFAFGYF